MNSYGFGCKVIKQPVGRKSHDLILIWKGSFNETIDPKILHVQYKQYVSPTCGYIVTVKTFDERHWQQREGILRREDPMRRRYWKVTHLILSLQPTNQQK